MNRDSETVFSVLDLASVREGGTVAESFRNTVKLGQAAEAWGYHRFWLAEHHNMAGIASAATLVLIGPVAVAPNEHGNWQKKAIPGLKTTRQQKTVSLRTTICQTCERQ